MRLVNDIKAGLAENFEKARPLLLAGLGGGLVGIGIGLALHAKLSAPKTETRIER